MNIRSLALFAIGLFVAGASATSIAANESVTVQNDDWYIYYHGRWDSSPGTWWAGSGLKLNVVGLESLSLNLGNRTSAPFVSLGVSVDYKPFYQVNVSAGINTIPLNGLKHDSGSHSNTIVRINVEGWEYTRINLETITLNPGAQLVPYFPSELAFQYIGDSLSAGQYLPQGVNQAWTFLTGEAYKAEYVVTAQPGAALSDIYSYGNEHGMSYQFFRTEDSSYVLTTDHNYTTPWNFGRDVPTATHVVIHIGANDARQNVTSDSFVQVYEEFFVNIRQIYKYQPIFVFTPWGWLSATNDSYYYPGAYEEVVQHRHSLGDKNVFLVNTTGWVDWNDVYHDNLHPTPEGHQKIARLFQQWLENWGLYPRPSWATGVL